MEKIERKIYAIGVSTILIFMGLIFYTSVDVKADTYNGEDLALAILVNQSTLVSSSYSDTDSLGNRMSAVLTSKGTLSPTYGSSFAFFSTGIAETDIVTTDEENPGSERGNWFSGGQYGYPRDQVSLEMILSVPAGMHYLYYDVQFFSSEYPEYVGSQYNDKFTISVESPTEGTSTYVFDVNSGYFVLDSDGITGTGFDIYAQSGYPNDVDWVDTTPRSTGADGGASDLIPIGGASHPVSPYEQVTVTISIQDDGDNQFDSAAFIDNLMFSGFSLTNVSSTKTYTDLNDGNVEPGDIIRYRVTINNNGYADQSNNDGDEFEDMLPANVTFIDGSLTATSGTIAYDQQERKITWNGGIIARSQVSMTFDVFVNESCKNGTIISNQGTVHWDDDEDGTNNAVKLTDDPHVQGEGGGPDPTNFTVIAFEAPAYVIEDFSDDPIGEAASNSFMNRLWFETTKEEGESNFEIAVSYYNATPGSFKTKLREAGSPQHWYYNFSNLESFATSWKISFKCGNATEASTMFLNISNSNDDCLVRFKYAYEKDGSQPPLDWVLHIYYWSPGINDWVELWENGNLYNNWYQLAFSRVSHNRVQYMLLDRDGVELDSQEDYTMTDYMLERSEGSTFSNIASVEWRNIYDAVVCPMFFWDDHIIGLIPE